MIDRGSIGRREFLAAVAGAAAFGALGIAAGAQEETRNTVSGPMQQDAYRPVRLPPKSGPHATLTEAQRDDLEHHLQCQCGCTLDVFTCRTTDFSCSVSPAMHMDVVQLIAGGYDAPAILKAFAQVYGERVLMEPVKQGFNWLGYFLPFGVIAAGGVVVLALLRRWSTEARSPATETPNIDATPDELAKVRDALRNDE